MGLFKFSIVEILIEKKFLLKKRGEEKENKRKRN